MLKILHYLVQWHIYVSRVEIAREMVTNGSIGFLVPFGFVNPTILLAIMMHLGMFGFTNATTVMIKLFKRSGNVSPTRYNIYTI